VFYHILKAMRAWYLFLTCSKTGDLRHDRIVRFSYYFFMSSDVDLCAAYVMLVINVVMTVLLIGLELLGCCIARGFHTWWLLNYDLAKSAIQAQEFTPADQKVQQRMSGLQAGNPGELQESSSTYRAPGRQSSFPLLRRIASAGD